jgi:transcriptional regulator with GAF, ATPase, and Fis domain
VQEAVLGRLGAQPIVLPPLRDRIEDIGRLVAHFLRNLRDGRAFEPEAFHALCLHGWPLNVRELSKVIDEAEALSRARPPSASNTFPTRSPRRCSWTWKTTSRRQTSIRRRRPSTAPATMPA